MSSSKNTNSKKKQGVYVTPKLEDNCNNVLEPKLIGEGERWAYGYQNQMFNAFSKCLPSPKSNYVECNDDGEVEFSRNGCTFFIDGYDNKTLKLRLSLHQYFLFINMQFFAQHKTNKELIEIPIRKYQELRKLKDVRDAVKEVTHYNELLSRTVVTYQETKDGKPIAGGQHLRIPITGKVGLINGKNSMAKNKVIVFKFSEDLIDIIERSSTVKYPYELIGLNNKTEQDAFTLTTKIIEHMTMNRNKSNRCYIKFTTLLGFANNIPSYEKVMAGNRDVRGRILDKFEYYMDVMKSTYTWDFCNKGGDPLREYQVNNMQKYDVFHGLYVRIIWLDKETEPAKPDNPKPKKNKKKKKNK